MAEGMDIFSEEWDLLIILDAARPDMLQEVAPDWPVETRKSPATESWQFMRESFVGRTFHDTVYVTVNPHAEKLPAETFHAQLNLLDSGWDEECQTVPPDVVVQATLEAAADYPEKRVIAHFMQPHYPFLGETGAYIQHTGLGEDCAPHPWFAAMYNKSVNMDTLREAYRENHELVVPHVEQLLDGFEGKVVATADHANLIGERGRIIPIRLFGHPGNFPHPNLRTVPWVEFEYDSRREVSEDSPDKQSSIEGELLNERLEALGYR